MKMTQDDIEHYVAQAVINIDSGLTQIERDSKIYWALVNLIETWQLQKNWIEDKTDKVRILLD